MGFRILSPTKIMMPFASPYMRAGVMHAVSAQPGVDANGDILPYSSWSSTIVGSSSVLNLSFLVGTHNYVHLATSNTSITINCASVPVGFVFSLLSTNTVPINSASQVPYIYCETLNSAFNPTTGSAGTITLNFGAVPTPSVSNNRIFRFPLRTPQGSAGVLFNEVSGSTQTATLVNTNIPASHVSSGFTAPAPWFINYYHWGRAGLTLSPYPCASVQVNCNNLHLSTYTAPFIIHWYSSQNAGGLLPPTTYPIVLADFGGSPALRVIALSTTQIQLENFNGPGLSPVLTVPLTAPGEICGTNPHKYSILVDRDSGYFEFYYDYNNSITFNSFNAGQFWYFLTQPRLEVREIYCEELSGGYFLNRTGYIPSASDSSRFRAIFTFQINDPVSL